MLTENTPPYSFSNPMSPYLFVRIPNIRINQKAGDSSHFIYNSRLLIWQRSIFSFHNFSSERLIYYNNNCAHIAATEIFYMMTMSKYWLKTLLRIYTWMLLMAIKPNLSCLSPE